MATSRVSLADNILRSEVVGNGSQLHASLYHSHHYRQSPNLPRRLYALLCTLFQVETTPRDRCIIGKLIFFFTLAVSLGYGGLGIVFTVYDIKSANTTQTVTTGLFNIFITLLWVALGIYANRLGKRILKSTTFLGSLRIHSKTVFKVPATLLVSLIALSSVGIETYRTYSYFWDMKACHKVNIYGAVCRAMFIFKVVQVLMVFTFNICVAAAVLSICRTHTVGVRKFIRALESDGHACELKHRQRFMKMQFAASHDLNELYLPEQCYRDSDSDSIDGDGDNQSLITYVPDDTGASHPTQEATSVNSVEPRPRPEAVVLSKDDILFSYWKLASRMRMTSQTLQRWMSSWITFTILWLLHWIFIWLNHPSTFLEIAQFILPLLITLILCTAYGETNSEVAKIISNITPLQDRLEIIKTLPNISMGMTLYNHPINYGSILTVVAALGLALSSRMILDEFLPPSPHS